MKSYPIKIAWKIYPLFDKNNTQQKGDSANQIKPPPISL